MEPILIAIIGVPEFHINEKKEAMEEIKPDHPPNYPAYPEFLKRVPKFTTRIYSLLVPSREWMGCWGLLWWLLLVMKWIIPENSLRKTHQ